ncbi:DNA polymerase III subunit beta [Pseudonocardia nigra]|uniref:DNA polymerase III subunit beta n=1 Tax=Pseudonocardia nigra TaxID=1921578 RepID=UPI001C5CDAEE|nr:DNA polymerase III subunit beta [Pseudonocardia nigra]
MTQIVLTGAVLHKAAAWAVLATSTRPSAPVLAGLLLDAPDTSIGGGEASVTGYDLHTRATVTIPATVLIPGRLLLSGRLLVAVAKTVARDTDVAITTDPHLGVLVRCGRAEWHMPALPIQEYPTLPDLGDPLGTIDPAQLRRALGQVLPALDRSSTALPAFTAVKIETEPADTDEADPVLTLVGTDRYRLAAATIPWQPTSSEVQVDALVPWGLLDTALRAITTTGGTGGGDPDERVALCCTERGFGLATGTHLVTGRQLAEEYPAWRRFLPEPGPHRAVVEVAPLVQALGQALIAVDDAPYVLLAVDDGRIEVSATGGQSTARAAVAAELTGPPITVKVNAGYLRDAVALHGCDRVAIAFGATGNKPLLVLGDDPGYRHTVVPVRLDTHERSAA